MAYEKRVTKGRDYWMQMKQEAIRKHRTGERLTLEETSYAIWDPSTEKHPMTCMGVLKIEKRALEKLREALKQYHINDLSDVIEPRFREFGKPVSSSYDNP